ncbi:hypothetical protein TSTA_093910 [Talaromyces stipitatus ATCC 10500]|uniref:Uncharacterized protein n=1 Tax=Talaromyces stipitatus (strain ATCC 10500 / CBS 375.48 / QM 6759 / NRRL 1006) TaxID=441959 RepID=B8M1Q8_TALSN|nr:uncharacterized protein TSTA_093910 [Talaromyces stipitatus ATCC 10500]EED22145.1 hypothetical protein TSTA_093910 [Talaromyces stipitatus ATCC 10500]
MTDMRIYGYTDVHLGLRQRVSLSDGLTKHQTVVQGYCSATEYHFDEEQADAIVRTAFYHCKDDCLSVIWFPSSEHAAIRSSIATPFAQTSSTGLGFLICCPLSTCMKPCLGWKQTLYSSFQRLNPGRDMYPEAMSFPMHSRGSGNINATLASARKKLHLAKAEVMRLKSFKTLTGTYSMDEIAQKSRIAIVSVTQAILVCDRQPSGSTQAQPENAGRNQKYNFMGAYALPYSDKQTGTVEHGISCGGCQLALEKRIIGGRGENWALEARDSLCTRLLFSTF